MAELNLTTFDYALKVKYPKQRVEKLFYQSCPTFAMIPKGTGFVGKSLYVPLKYGTLTSVSAAFSTAQTNKNHASGTGFNVTRVKKYAIGGLDNETVEASMNDEGAFLRAAGDEIEDTIKALAKVVSDELFGSGDGHIGTVSGPGASTTLTLVNSEDVRHFEAGMRLVTAPDATSSLNDAGAVGTVSAVNRAAGTLTMAVNVSTTWPSAATGHLIFREGDYTTASDAKCLSGLAAYLPGSASPGALFGMTRTTDVTRLAGVYSNSTLKPGLSTEEALLWLATLIAREGGKPNLAVIGMLRWNGLINALGSKVNYNKVTTNITNGAGKVVATVGFDTVKIQGPAGSIDVLADPACPEDKVYELQTDTWKMESLGALPRPVLKDGKYVRDSHDTDGLEIRVGYYGNLTCRAPGWNGVYTF